MQKNETIISEERIDGGREFAWGRTSDDYARWRNSYPPEVREQLLASGVCAPGQDVLDVGTGTGIIPRMMYDVGARFTGVDISQGQIEAARRLAREEGKKIEFLCIPLEKLELPPDSFDAVTAMQCFFYFDSAAVLPKLHSLLRPGGRLAICYISWLPLESKIAGASEQLILKHNPAWTGHGHVRRPIAVPKGAEGLFVTERAVQLDVAVPFTRESWHGRIRACRGCGASMSPETLAAFCEEHERLLAEIAPERFDIPHTLELLVLRSTK